MKISRNSLSSHQLGNSESVKHPRRQGGGVLILGLRIVSSSSVSVDDPCVNCQINRDIPKKMNKQDNERPYLIKC